MNRDVTRLRNGVRAPRLIHRTAEDLNQAEGKRRHHSASAATCDVHGEVSEEAKRRRRRGGDEEEEAKRRRRRRRNELNSADPEGSTGFTPGGAVGSTDRRWVFS
ncbi:uncharacterized protein V6R79_015169 [Siganus canaliculatus]